MPPSVPPGLPKVPKRVLLSPCAVVVTVRGLLGQVKSKAAIPTAHASDMPRGGQHYRVAAATAAIVGRGWAFPTHLLYVRPCLKY